MPRWLAASKPVRVSRLTSSKLVVERIRPQSLLRTCSTLNTSAVTSNDWPCTVLKTLARRALRKFIHGFRQVLRGSRRSEEHTSELQSHSDLVCRLLLEKKK